MPENTVSVCRPGKWGNPHRVGMCPVCGAEHTREEAVMEFEEDLKASGAGALEIIRREIGGKNLACFCRLDQACHADVLLRVANASLEPLARKET